MTNAEALKLRREDKEPNNYTTLQYLKTAFDNLNYLIIVVALSWLVSEFLVLENFHKSWF